MKKLSKVLLCAFAVVAVAVLAVNIFDISGVIEEFCILPPERVSFCILPPERVSLCILPYEEVLF